MEMIKELDCPKCGKKSGHTKEQYQYCTIVYNVRCKVCGGIVIKPVDIFD